MALHTEGTKRKPFITKNMSTPKYPDSNNPKWNSTTAMIAMPFKESISCLYSKSLYLVYIPYFLKILYQFYPLV